MLKEEEIEIRLLRVLATATTYKKVTSFAERHGQPVEKQNDVPM